MNLVDRYCYQQFPEIEDYFEIEELEQASGFGSYIYHEDYFCPFVIEHYQKTEDKDFLEKVGNYIEYLITSENADMRNLASIGVIECLIDKHFFEIAPYLKPYSKASLKESRDRVKFDLVKWVLA